MIAIVPPHTDNLLRSHRRQQISRTQRHRIEIEILRRSSLNAQLECKIFLRRSRRPGNPKLSAALFHGPITHQAIPQKSAILHRSIPFVLIDSAPLLSPAPIANSRARFGPPPSPRIHTSVLPAHAHRDIPARPAARSATLAPNRHRPRADTRHIPPDPFPYSAPSSGRCPLLFRFPPQLPPPPIPLAPTVETHPSLPQ